MVKVIIIDKTRNKKNTEIKKFNVEELYKKCNLRKNDNFEKRHTWQIKNSNLYVSIFTKDKGRANSENKYDLPPPLDEKLYYGSLLLVKHEEEDLTNENAKDLSLEDWGNLYEELFGGFEDLNGEDSYSEEEEIPENMKTSSGYSKEGGFIVEDDAVEDDEVDDEEYIPEDEDEGEETETEEDEDEDPLGQESDIDVDNEDDDEDDEDEEYDSSEDFGSELSEESYADSD